MDRGRPAGRVDTPLSIRCAILILNIFAGNGWGEIGRTLKVHPMTAQHICLNAIVDVT